MQRPVYIAGQTAVSSTLIRELALIRIEITHLQWRVALLPVQMNCSGAPAMPSPPFGAPLGPAIEKKPRVPPTGPYGYDPYPDLEIDPPSGHRDLPRPPKYNGHAPIAQIWSPQP